MASGSLWGNQSSLNESFYCENNETCYDDDGNNHTFKVYDNETSQDAAVIISDEVQYYIVLWVIVVITPGISVFGVITSIIDMVIFVKQGIKDCMTVSLFSLALAHCNQVIWILLWSASFAGTLFFPVNPHVDFDAFISLSSKIMTIFTAISVLLTVFITLQRCLCVVLPFRFKEFYTFKRSVIVICAFVILEILTKVPFFYSFRLVWLFDERVNGTRLTMRFVALDSQLDNVITTFRVVIIRFGSQVVVVVATVLTCVGLMKSGAFRRQIASTGNDLQKPIQDLAKIAGMKENSESLSPSSESQQKPSCISGLTSTTDIASKVYLISKTNPSDIPVARGDDVVTGIHPATETRHDDAPDPAIKTDHIIKGLKPRRISVTARRNKVSKEMRLTKMIITLAVVFALLRLPEVIAGIVMVSMDSVRLTKANRNFYTTVGAVLTLFKAIGSTVNIVVYYNMSATFRRILRRLLGLYSG